MQYVSRRPNVTQRYRSVIEKGIFVDLLDCDRLTSACWVGNVNEAEGRFGARQIEAIAQLCEKVA